MFPLVVDFPAFSILLALSCGVVCGVLKGKKAAAYCLFWNVVIFIMSLMVLLYTVKTGESYTYMMGRWGAPFGNEIRVGILEAVMASGFSGVMLLSVLGGLKHIEEDVEEEKMNLYFTLISFLLTSLLALIYTNDMFTAYVFVEINTIASCALVMIKNGGKTLVATIRYLIMSLLGSGLFLLAIIIMYGITGHLLMENMAASVQSILADGQFPFSLTVAVALFSVSMAVKGALFPFHSWLPDAHGSATASSSAVLSGLVIKGYIIVLIKIYYRVFGLPAITRDRAANVLFAFGIAAMIIGSLKAMQERDLKRMLAYSSVAQVGYIFAGIGLATPAGMLAACIQILVHAITKPMLFVSAGGFMDVSDGSKQAEDITGAGLRDKLAGAAFTVGALSMIGIPLFAGFVTKVHLTAAGLEENAGRMVVLLVGLIISTVLNALYYMPVVFNLFSRRRDDKFEGVKAHYGKNMGYVISLTVFILLNLCMGIFSDRVVSLLTDGLAMFGM